MFGACVPIVACGAGRAEAGGGTAVAPVDGAMYGAGAAGAYDCDGRTAVGAGRAVIGACVFADGAMRVLPPTAVGAELPAGRGAGLVVA